MIRVSLNIQSGAAHFRAAVWAESIERALSLADARYPGCKVKVLFPIDPEAFFVKGPVPASGIVRPEAPEGATG